MFLQIYLYKNCETLDTSTINEKTNIKERVKKSSLNLI